MTTGVKIAVVALLALAVAATFALRGGKRAEYVPVPDQSAVQGSRPREGSVPVAHPPPVQEAAASAASAPVRAEPAAAASPVAAAARPRILELGSTRCQACQEMAKVLEALRASQGAKLQVDFIDVFEQPDAAERYKIALIPTQIFFDRTGQEVFRHQGFMAHDDILAKFRTLGVEL